LRMNSASGGSSSTTSTRMVRLTRFSYLGSPDTLTVGALPCYSIFKEFVCGFPMWNAADSEPLAGARSLMLTTVFAESKKIEGLREGSAGKMFANLKPRILVVDDEPQMRSALRDALL